MTLITAFLHQVISHLLKENLPEGKGGNFIVKENPTNVHNVEVNDEYELLDVDTVSDLEAIKKLERLRHGIQN